MSKVISKTNRSFFNNLAPVQIKDKPLAGHTSSSSEIILISINNTGTRLVTSRTDKSIRIWKCNPDRLSDPLIIEDAHTRPIELVAWNPKTEHSFVTVGRDTYVKLWKGHTGSLERQIKVEKTLKQLDATMLIHVSYSPDGELLAVVDRDSTLFLYSVAQNYKKVHETRLAEHVYEIQWFHEGHLYFICALHDGTLPIYKVTDVEDSDGDVHLELKTQLTGHRSSATAVKIDPRGTYLAVGSSEGVISLWNTATMLNSKVITDVDESISSLGISRDGAYVASSYDNGSNIIIYDNEAGKKVYEVPNSMSGKMAFSCITWFPNKTSFAYTSDFGTTLTLMKKP